MKVVPLGEEFTDRKSSSEEKEEKKKIESEGRTNRGEREWVRDKWTMKEG